MSQVNVNPNGTRSDAAGWSAATIGMLVGFLVLLLVLVYFLATQAGWMQPVTIINQQPATERERTTIIQPAPQSPSSSTSSTSGTTGTTGTTGAGTGSTTGSTGTTGTTGNTTTSTTTTGTTVGR